MKGYRDLTVALSHANSSQGFLRSCEVNLGQKPGYKATKTSVQPLQLTSAIFAILFLSLYIFVCPFYFCL